MQPSIEQLLLRRDRVLHAVAGVTDALARAPIWRSAVPEVLRILGDATGVSRVYVFEVFTDADGRQYGSQRFEWVAPGVTPQIDLPELQNIDLLASGFDRWCSELSAGRTISGEVEDFPESEKPLLEMQEILSILVHPLFDGDRWWGFLGFDACAQRQKWSAVEIDALRIASRGISGAIFNESRERELRIGIDLLSETIVDVDGDGVLRYANRAWRALLGYGMRETLGKRLADFVHDDDWANVHQRLQRGHEADGDRVEVRMRRADGSWCWVTLAVAALPNGGFICAAHDVTAWHERAAAIAASKAKSDFLAKMSHEIRTPLNAIMGLVYLTAESGLPEPQASYVRKIQVASGMMLGTINDILDFSKIEANALVLEQRPFSLRALLRGLDAIVGSLAQQKSLEWTMTMDADVPDIHRGDALRLEQVLTNLASNAVKFTTSGAVHLRVRLEGTRGEQVMLRFEVQDSGIGMSEEEAAQVFAPFHQAEVGTARRFGGTGLGLSIARHLVEAMGGRITVTSTPGRGSLFVATVLLGQIEGDAASLELEPEAGGSPHTTAAQHPLDGRRILVAEDNSFNQLVIREILKRFGATVVLVGDGQQALDAFDREGPFEGVLLDVQMPVMDGYEAARALRKRPGTQHLPVFAITANVTPQDRERCLEAGMDDLIPKPIEPERLGQLLGTWIATGRPNGIA